MQRSFQLNRSFWMAAVAYAIAGTCVFLTTSWARPVFTNLDDDFPLPIRVVMSVAPAGWLALALLGALVTLWVPSTHWRLVSAILILLLSIAVMCTVMFTNIERPIHIRASNHPASGNGAIASLFPFEGLGRAVPEPGR